MLECEYEIPGTPPEWYAVQVVEIHDCEVKLLYTSDGSTEELKESDFDPASFRIPTLPQPKKTKLTKKKREDQAAKQRTTLQTRTGKRTDKAAATKPKKTKLAKKKREDHRGARLERKA